MKTESTVEISAYVDNASRERVLQMLDDVTKWQVNFNIPSDSHRNMKALELQNKILADDESEAWIHRARKFLRELREDERAGPWLGKVPK